MINAVYNLTAGMRNDRAENSIMQTITIAVSAILIAAGLITAPGLINNARDNNARGDLANIAYAQEVLMADSANYSDKVNKDDSDVDGWYLGSQPNIKYSLSADVDSSALVCNDPEWAYLLKSVSDSGTTFFRSSDGAKTSSSVDSLSVADCILESADYEAFTSDSAAEVPEVPEVVADGATSFNSALPAYTTTKPIVGTVATSTLVQNSTGQAFLSSTNSVSTIDLTTNAVTPFVGASVSGNVDGKGAAARFWRIKEMAFDTNDNLYITENNLNGLNVRKATPDGTVSTLINLPNKTAEGMTISNGFIYLAGYGSKEIYKVSLTGDLTVISIADTGTAATPAVAISPSGEIYFTGLFDGVYKINSDGTKTKFVATQPKAMWDITFDSAGNLYIAGYSNNKIFKVTPDGTMTTVANVLDTPTFIYIGNDGKIYTTTTKGIVVLS